MLTRIRAFGPRRRLAVLLGGALLVLPWPALFSAQDVKVPVEVQFDLLTKILVFDRNLKARVGEEIVVGVVFQSLYRASLAAKDEFLSAAEKSRDLRIDGLAIRCIAIDLKNDLPLEDVLAEDKIDVLYVAPLRAYDIRTIAAASRARRILSLTGVPEYVRNDLAVGIDAIGGKPRILINLAASKAEGCDFSSKLLNLATVIQ